MQRASTITNAFVRALAGTDKWDDAGVRRALTDLSQDPERLTCVYCGDSAATWDHVHATVVKGRYSGFGHRIRNLVPACRTCNEKKGGRDWRIWMNQPHLRSREGWTGRLESLQRHQAAGNQPEIVSQQAEFYALLAQVHELMRRADVLASKIRDEQPMQSTEEQPAPHRHQGLSDDAKGQTSVVGTAE
jgi:hypothetical protein